MPKRFAHELRINDIIMIYGNYERIIDVEDMDDSEEPNIKITTDVSSYVVEFDDLVHVQ